MRRLGALGTLLNPTGLEVRAALTSPCMHPNGIFDKNAPFCRSDMCISLGFFWMLFRRENPSQPFYHHAGLSLILVPHGDMRPLLHRAMTPHLCVPPWTVEGSQAGGVSVRDVNREEARSGSDLWLLHIGRVLIRRTCRAPLLSSALHGWRRPPRPSGLPSHTRIALAPMTPCAYTATAVTTPGL